MTRPVKPDVSRRDRFLYRLDQWKKKLRRKHEGGWRGVSILIFPHNAGSPYRVRINYYAILFTFLLFGVVGFLAVFYELKRRTLDLERLEQMQTSEVLLSNHHVVLAHKVALLHETEEQMEKLYRLSWNGRMEPEMTEPFKHLEQQILSTGSRFDTDMERYRIYRTNADHIFVTSGQIALKGLWHAAHLYWITPRGWPVYPGTASISSGYGSRMDPFLKTVPGDFHGGLDFAAGANTPILASAPGTVIRAIDKNRSGYGLHVMIHHGLGYQTLYAHCNKVLVESGERVQKGQVIALIGRSGQATGNHLHYEVRFGLAKPVDPMPYVGLK